MNALTIRALGITAASVLALAANSAAADPPHSTGVRISGHVVDGAGKPVAGADVTLYQFMPTRVCVGPLRSLTTSAAGEFTVNFAIASTYLVKVVSPGFAPGLRSQYLEKGQRADPRARPEGRNEISNRD
jgi:Carboxypeptidase regulatory-like domain